MILFDPIFPEIEAGLAEALLKEMARSLPSPFLATLSDSDTARARYAFKE